MKIDDIRQGVGALWESVAEGWERLRRSAAGALTKCRSGDTANLPAHEEIDDANYLPNNGWAMLGGDVFEDDKRCAYGSFLRSVPLPAAVKSERSRATYRNGVLKVELPKAAPGTPSVTQVRVG